MVDECKNSAFVNGAIMDTADCPWEVVPLGYRIEAGAFHYKAVAYRPTTGTPNSLNPNVSYNVYA